MNCIHVEEDRRFPSVEVQSYGHVVLSIFVTEHVRSQEQDVSSQTAHTVHRYVYEQLLYDCLATGEEIALIDCCGVVISVPCCCSRKATFNCSCTSLRVLP